VKVGLLAAWCHPDHGSEPGVGWAWLSGLTALGHDVHLVTRVDPEWEAAVRAAAPGPGRLRITTLPDAAPAPLRALTGLVPGPMRAEWGYLSGYVGWLSEVDDLVRDGGLSDVDVVHHVSLGSVHSGSTSAGPLVFGPVGGGQRCPVPLRPLLGGSVRGEVLRDLAAAARRRPGSRFAATMRRAGIVLAGNRDTAGVARRHGARRVELMMPAAVPDATLPATAPERDLAEPVLLWVGSLRPCKAPALAVRAFALLGSRLPAARLRFVGDGPLAGEVRALVTGLGVADRVEFTGTVAHADMPKQYADATLLLFTSVRDTFGDQVLEAWAAGLPTVSFAHQGVGDFSPPLGSALVGPCAAAQAPARFAAAAAAVLGDPGGYPARCAAALAHARRHTLSARTARAVSLYEELLAQRAGERASSRW
jgi:glycosyltransferase involved in cell wall biosynthesis